MTKEAKEYDEMEYKEIRNKGDDDPKQRKRYKASNNTQIVKEREV